ncbi:MAG: helix-turn-helix transcriptional regulator [Rhodocyclales bacterium]|nr:helix-turn-helix transcriptional regulator [Rhodocyclales bacterium]
MEQDKVLQVFEALSSTVRLDAFRLLVRAGGGGCVAGEIAAALALPPNNLSFHLKALTQSGLVTVEQEGRFQRYRANIRLMLDTVAYLMENCCGDNPQACAELRGGMFTLTPIFESAQATSGEDGAA